LMVSGVLRWSPVFSGGLWWSPMVSGGFRWSPSGLLFVGHKKWWSTK